MDAKTRELVRMRAGNRCEYCLLRQEQTGLAHHVEHITAKQHGGPDDPENLALACNRCNACKGPNLTGIDVETSLSSRSSTHAGTYGQSTSSSKEPHRREDARGRATVLVLEMNDESGLNAGLSF